MSVRRATILMVEDEPDILKSNREYLAARQYQVISANTVEEARRLFRQHRPDLVLLDVMLPDGNGFDFCREIRLNAAIPVIYLTGLGGSDDIIRGLALGGSDYIVKPYDMKVLEARIAAKLRDVGQFVSGRLIELPPLRVNLITGEATLEGLQVRLSQKELQLLAFFVDHAGQRLSREKLYEAVWGATPNNSTHTVTEHVHRLKKKLKMDEDTCAFRLVAEGPDYLFCKVKY